MSAQGRVTADEFVTSLRRRHAALPSEIGTFIVFEACELMIASAPTALTLQTLSITEEGAVSLSAAALADEEDAARCLHRILTRLLVAAGPPPTPALLRLVEQGPLGGQWSLDPLRDALEEVLVPLNRTASRRVLARLVRETARDAPAAARAAPRASFVEVDRELNILLGIDDAQQGVPLTEQPTARVAPPLASPVAAAPRPAPYDTEYDSVYSVDDARDDVRVVPSRVVESPAPSLGRLEPVTEHRSQGLGTLVGVALIVIALALGAIILVLRPGVLARLQGREVAAERARPQGTRPQAPMAGDLTVRVTNERAQILRFVGRGPATVRHLPLGVAHEFVVVPDAASGALPARALVASDAAWEHTADGLRYEIAIQAGTRETAATWPDLGDTLLTAEVGVAQGLLGSVRIVTTPRGAKVYQLIGFAPEAKIQGLALDHDEELLIWKRGHGPVARVVTASEFVSPPGDATGPKQAVVEVTLPPADKGAQ